MYWSAKAASDCDLIDEVVIAVDSVRVWNVCRAWLDFPKVRIVRVAEMDDKCMQETPMMEFTEKNEYDHIILMQATNPLTRHRELSAAIRKYLICGYDSLISTARMHRFIWKDGKANYDPQNRPRRQDWDGLQFENGCFFVTSRNTFLSSKCRISGKIGTYEMPSDTFFDIDEPDDWDIMELLLRRRHE